MNIRLILWPLLPTLIRKPLEVNRLQNRVPWLFIKIYKQAKANLPWQSYSYVLWGAWTQPRKTH
ncbi:MAG: hypothetical protein KI790_20645, partial [Cyclobacteriaceae bacterium]|nr:hypothetical protein [Cyclobacteriaceae bacterium HetDA_MAG_MS6]